MAEQDHQTYPIAVKYLCIRFIKSYTILWQKLYL